MCHQFVPVYEACGHRYDAAAELSRCLENCAVPKEDLVTQQTTQKCPDCEGDHVPDYSTGEYFKCCSFSRICDHEYDHFVSEIDREGHEDIVLVTPMLDTCPDCTKSMEKSGHKLPADMKESQVEAYRREASRLPTFRMQSKMPADFEDLERKNTADVKSVSHLPRTSFLPPSAAPRDTYNPSALRVPAPGQPSIRPSVQQSVRPSIRPSVAPAHSTRGTDSGSKYPSASVVSQSTRPATAIHDSQPSVRQSVAPSVRPSNRPSASVAPSLRPSTSPEASVRPSVRPQASKPPLTAAELLKRGPPRNVAASAFYENPDGDEARANIIQQSRKPPEVTKMRTEYGGHTAAPRGSEASLDLEKLMGEHSITQSTMLESSRRPESASRAPSASQRPSGSTSRPSEHSMPPRTSRGHSVMPPRESRTPGGLSTPRQSHVPSSSQAPGASRAPSASTRPQGNAGTALPPYKTMAGEESKWPTNAPPTYKTPPGASRAPVGGAHRGGAGGGRGQGAIPEEEDIYNY